MGSADYITLSCSHEISPEKDNILADIMEETLLDSLNSLSVADGTDPLSKITEEFPENAKEHDFTESVGTSIPPEANMSVKTPTLDELASSVETTTEALPPLNLPPSEIVEPLKLAQKAILTEPTETTPSESALGKTLTDILPTVQKPVTDFAEPLESAVSKTLTNILPMVQKSAEEFAEPLESAMSKTLTDILPTVQKSIAEFAEPLESTLGKTIADSLPTVQKSVADFAEPLKSSIGKTLTDIIPTVQKSILEFAEPLEPSVVTTTEGQPTPQRPSSERDIPIDSAKLEASFDSLATLQKPLTELMVPLESAKNMTSTESIPPLPNFSDSKFQKLSSHPPRLSELAKSESLPTKTQPLKPEGILKKTSSEATAGGKVIENGHHFTVKPITSECELRREPVFVDRPDVTAIDCSDEEEITDTEDGSASKSSRPKVPDGGWGWVVVLSATIISMIGDGTAFSFGLLYMKFLEYYGESKSKTSWIGSLFMAVPLLLGPVGSALVDRFGCRSMTMLGGIISGTGFILSSVSKTIEQQYLTFGFIAGLGLCLCYVTAVVSVAYWFDKKRTLATSLGSCGTGVGTFVYAPVTSYFISEYGWRGTILLLSGPFFNLCVCGAVMRDPEWLIKEQKEQRRATARTTSQSVGKSGAKGSTGDFPRANQMRRKSLRGVDHPVVRLTGVNAVVSSSSSTPRGPGSDSEDEKKGIKEQQTLANKAHFTSVINIPTFIKQNEKVPLEVLETLSENKRVFNVILENYPSLLHCRSLSDHDQLHQTHGVGGSRVPITMSMRVKPTRRLTSSVVRRTGSRDGAAGSSVMSTSTQPLLDNGEPNGSVTVVSHRNSTAAIPRTFSSPRTDSLPLLRRQFSIKEHYPQYLKDLRAGHRNSVMYRSAAYDINKYKLRASSCPNIYRNHNHPPYIAQQIQSRWWAETKELFKGMTDFSMFLELHFFLISLSTILLFTWFIVPYFYLTDFIINQKVMTEAEATSIISVIGITNTIGMVLLGWAGDYPWMNVTKTYAICLVGCGITLILMPFFTTNYWAMVFTCAGFGVFFASNFSFTPTILVELIPLERFTTAYGLTLLCQGIGNLLGPPLAGWFFDVTSIWDYSFYLAGFWIIISGFLVAAIPITENRRIWGDGETEYQRSEV